MAVIVKHCRVVRANPVDVVAHAIFPRDEASGEKNRIVFHKLADRPGLWVIVPLLQEQDTSFDVGVRPKGVYVKADGRDNASTGRYECAKFVVCNIIEPSLWQHDGKPPSWTNKLKISLQEENVSADLLAPFPFSGFRKFVLTKYSAFLDVSGERRIR
jgi:hypothetical protein